MFIQLHQLPEIISPKKGCQRGLEEYIVDQHWGDKKIYHEGGVSQQDVNVNDPSYVYLNNPIYRVGKEGDPAPGSLSSRSIYQIGDNQEGLTETESALHLLYPTIDSGIQFAYQKPWDMHWYYSRTNIPNMLGTSEQVAESQNRTRVYDDSVERKRASHMISDWMNRPLPIYDQQRVADELLPDGVRQLEMDGVLNKKGIPIVGNTPGEHQVTGNTHTENYNGPHVKVPSAGYGAYGYPQPHGYATVGDSKHKYDVYPGYIPGVNVEYFGYLQNNNTNNLLWVIAIAVVMGLFLVIRKK